MNTVEWYLPENYYLLNFNTDPYR
uniref:Uncharacterized protein n=1 Tax=Lepeophtheirus salmonis TaxID=72036 RepID=A0A0K2VKK2_LEPSM